MEVAPVASTTTGGPCRRLRTDIDLVTLPAVPLAKLPYPPLELANRVGSLEDAAVPLDYYEELGRDTRGGIVELSLIHI